MSKLIYIIFLSSFFIKLDAVALTTKPRTTYKRLILTLSELNEGIVDYGSPPNFPCRDKNLDEYDSSLFPRDYFHKAKLMLLNLIESLINNPEIDSRGRKITQYEINQIVANFEKLKLRSEDLDKIIFMLGASRRITIKDRAYAIGALNDIQSVKKRMDDYLALGSVGCFFLYDNNIIKNLGSDSVFYHHDNLSEKDQTLFEIDPEVLMIVGRCKGRGLLVLPEFQN